MGFDTFDNVDIFDKFDIGEIYRYSDDKSPKCMSTGGLKNSSNISKISKMYPLKTS